MLSNTIKCENYLHISFSIEHTDHIHILSIGFYFIIFLGKMVNVYWFFFLLFFIYFFFFKKIKSIRYPIDFQ